jgi:hypothetical protein
MKDDPDILELLIRHELAIMDLQVFRGLYEEPAVSGRPRRRRAAMRTCRITVIAGPEQAVIMDSRLNPRRSPLHKLRNRREGLGWAGSCWNPVLARDIEIPYRKHCLSRRTSSPAAGRFERSPPDAEHRRSRGGAGRKALSG